MSKPKISFNRSGGAVCGTIRVPYFDDDGEGKLEISGFGINPMAALRKASEVASRIMSDPQIAPLIPPQAMVVIKAARALTQLDRKELEHVARNDETAPSARKLASVLGELNIGASGYSRRGQYGTGTNPAYRNKKYTPKYRKNLDRRNKALPQVDQYGNPLDPYGNPLDQYGQPMPMDPYNQGYNPYAQPQMPYDPYQQGMYPPPPPMYPGYPPQYGYQPQMYPQMYQPQGYDPYQGNAADQYFGDQYQQFAEQAWGQDAFAAQDDQYGQQAYGQQGYMADAGDDQGCEPYCPVE